MIYIYSCTPTTDKDQFFFLIVDRIMAAENLTEKIVEKVELAADVGVKVANVVGSAFEKTIADVDHSSGAEEDTWLNYLLSFGIHIAMVIIVILLKWQYGKNDESFIIHRIDSRIV